MILKGLIILILKNDHERSILFNFKLNQNEMNLLKEKANLYTEGNISEWIRYATLKLEPKSDDFIRIADESK
jgi:hypothetical protein